MTYGLIGEKLGHSYSQQIHESLGKYSYQLFSLSKTEFESFIAARNFDGLNITIPYKKAVIPFCDQVSDLAREIGAVNTLYFRDSVAPTRIIKGFSMLLRRPGSPLKIKKY